MDSSRWLSLIGYSDEKIRKSGNFRAMGVFVACVVLIALAILMLTYCVSLTERIGNRSNEIANKLKMEENAPRINAATKALKIQSDLICKFPFFIALLLACQAASAMIGGLLLLRVKELLSERDQSVLEPEANSPN